VRFIFPSLPNAHYDSEGEKYDLIHCMRCLSKNKKPWICDVEYASGLWVAMEKGQLSRRAVLKYLQSPYCKKILPWTRWCAEELRRLFPEVKDKIEIIYPPVGLKNFKKIKTGKTVLLYASRRFYFKGGLYALEVMDRITRKDKKIEGWIVSDVPKEVYEKYKKNSQIKFLGTLPQKELFERVYPSSDIFLYPSFTDTFGYVILEAMSFGLPVVSVGGQSREEIISQGKTGAVIKNPFENELNLKYLKLLEENVVGGLVREVQKILDSSNLRRKLSANCIAEVKKGKFSVSERNKKLNKIIRESIQ